MTKTILALMLALAGASCATAPPPPPEPSIYVMRHLQKAEGADPGLTAEGSDNAEKLADLLASDPPSAIYVSATRRAAETAAPLARRLHLTPQVYDPRDTPGLVARVKQEKGSVLVVGHSNTVPDIVEQLGAARPAPLAETDFGEVWRVSAGGAKVEKLRVGGQGNGAG